jgi:anti-sigma regulatory factor (Ser/Thr protein kinase)
MNSERCWLLGMIIFEAITNAARRVAHGGAGAIHLEVRGTPTSIACCIMDNGLHDESRYRGEDRSIVETLAAHLHGTVDVCTGSDGTRTVVTVPR